MDLEKKKQLKGSHQDSNNMGIIMGEEDRISELSNSLILHILSFLPIKCAVSTSILSRRWRYIWTSIQILDFRLWWYPKVRPSELETNSFMNFVDRVLFLHDIPKIQNFALDVDEHFSEFRVNAWIVALIKHKIEKLILSVHESKSFIFPSCFFTCESLTELELYMDHSVLNLPNSIYFPRLKILRLKSIIFVDETLTTQFFTNCPILEELRLTNCPWKDMDFLCISAPTLKHLFISSPYIINLFTTVKIYAPNLLSLLYNEIVPKDFDLHSFPSLVEADVDFIYDDDDHTEMREQTGYGSTKLLEKLSNVKKLRMTGETFGVLSYAVVPLTNLPSFGSLIHLEVTSSLLFSKVRTFFDFLQISPILESLVFTKACFDESVSDDGDDVLTPYLVPQCLVQHLKSVEFGRFYGYPVELEMVKLLLKNAGVLRMMTITSSYLEKNTEVMEQILMFPRGSVSCVVKFSHES